MKKRQNFRFWFLVLIFGFWIFNLYAMDVELFSLPNPPESKVLWKDKRLEVNGINASVSRLASNLKPEQIIEFYQDSLSNKGWKLKEHFEEQNLLVFTKDKEARFFYVVVQQNVKDEPNEVYLASSPQDLAVCKLLKDFFFKEEIAEDAPGKDIPEIPRFPLSRRRLSVFAPQQGAVLYYEAKAKAQEIAKFFAQNLKLAGWKAPQIMRLAWLKELAPELRDNEILLYQKGSDNLFIYIFPAPQEIGSGRSLIVISKNMLQEFLPDEKLEEEE